jgi:hypothetical protein
MSNKVKTGPGLLSTAEDWVRGKATKNQVNKASDAAVAAANAASNAAAYSAANAARSPSRPTRSKH